MAAPEIEVEDLTNLAFVFWMGQTTPERFRIFMSDDMFANLIEGILRIRSGPNPESARTLVEEYALSLASLRVNPELGLDTDQEVPEIPPAGPQRINPDHRVPASPPPQPEPILIPGDREESMDMALSF